MQSRYVEPTFPKTMFEIDHDTEVNDEEIHQWDLKLSRKGQ
jgi:hypothetical protein